MGLVLRFRDEQLEAQYVQHLDSLQCRLDVVVAVLGVFCMTVVARHARQDDSEHLVQQALMCLLCLALPMVVMLGSRRQYAARRQMWLLLWLPASWHFGCRAGGLYLRAAGDAPTLALRLAAAAQALQPQQRDTARGGEPPSLLLPHWWHTLQPGAGGGGWHLLSLPSRLFVRTELVPLLMINVGVRQVFPRHCLLHAVCLAIVAQHNCRRCASLAAELPWLLGAAARAAGAARRLSRWVFLLPLRGRLALVLHQLVDPRRGLAAWPEGRAAPGGGAAAASQAGCDHELLAACHAVLLFCQLLLSFCTPCYLLWRTEHASRRRFLAHVQRRDEQLPPQASSLHLLWLTPLAAATCWLVAEACAGLPA